MTGFFKSWQKLKLSAAAAVMLFLIFDRYSDAVDLPFILALLLSLSAYLTIATDVILCAFKTLFKHKRMTEQFLMTIATFGAFMLEDFPEALAVMVFYRTGQLFEAYASGSAHREISSLIELKPDTVRLVDESGQESIVKPRKVKIGDTIRVLKGEVIAIDGYLCEDTAAIDTKALTGESEPRLYTKGQSVPSGCINQGQVITLKVNTLHKNSSITRLLNMIEDAASSKSKPETLIAGFARFYTPVVVAFACILSLLPLFIPEASFADYVNRALVFLVLSCPCALVLSVPLSFFCGLGAISKKGVIVKGTVHIESLAHLKGAAFDKTGTLTQGKFTVSGYTSLRSDSELLFKVAASLESVSTHPVALSVVQHARHENIVFSAPENAREHSGLGIEALYEGRKAAVGRASFIREFVKEEILESDEAKTAVYVAYDGSLLGKVELSDELKENSQSALRLLKKMGIRLCLISGDRDAVVKAAGAALDMDEVYSERTPEQKLSLLKSFIAFIHERGSGKAAYVGDGLNDAPAIALADVGISMGQIGSASAVEASDVVIMNDNLMSLVKAVEISSRTYTLALSNLCFVMLVKLLILLLGAFGFASIWLAVFGDVGVLVLAVLNAMRALRFR